MRILDNDSDCIYNTVTTQLKLNDSAPMSSFPDLLAALGIFSIDSIFQFDGSERRERGDLNPQISDVHKEVLYESADSFNIRSSNCVIDIRAK